LIVSIQMVLGREELWLPRILSRRSFSRKALVSGFEKIKPQLALLEHFARPRLLVLTGRLATVLIGVVILAMAIVLILPLPPGGNFPPALACAILGMALVERDGVIVILGMAVTVAASIAAYFLVVLVVQSMPGITHWFAGLFGG
jgi:hypothetical protein